MLPFRFSSLQGCLLLLVWSRPCNSLWNVRIIRFYLFLCFVHVWCLTIAPFFKLLVLLWLCRELSLLVLASSLLLSDGQFWEWFLRHMASSYSSGLILSFFFFLLYFIHTIDWSWRWYFFVNLMMIFFCAVASGLHCQFSCRGYPFLVGCSNNHLSDRYVYSEA